VVDAKASTMQPVCSAAIKCSSICEKATSEVKEFISKNTTVKGATFNSRPWWHTCAIVGSSGSLLNSGLGRVIDRYDAVFRTNLAPYVGYENDVGSKTSVRVGNVKSIFGDQLFAKKFRGLSCGRELRAEKSLGAGSSNDGLTHVLPTLKVSDLLAIQCLQTPELNITLDLPENGAKLTTGMMSVAIALNLCERVSLFGYDSHEDYLNMSEAILKQQQDMVEGHVVHRYHYFDYHRPGHYKLAPKNDSTGHLVLNSNHDIASEVTWRDKFLKSSRCKLKKITKKRKKSSSSRYKFRSRHEKKYRFLYF